MDDGGMLIGLIKAIATGGSAVTVGLLAVVLLLKTYMEVVKTRHRRKVRKTGDESEDEPDAFGLIPRLLGVAPQTNCQASKCGFNGNETRALAEMNSQLKALIHVSEQGNRELKNIVGAQRQAAGFQQAQAIASGKKPTPRRRAPAKRKR